MKKIIITSMLCISFVIFGTTNVFAFESKVDLFFYNSLSDYASEESMMIDSLSYESELLYDYHNNLYGYIYTYSNNEMYGYMIIKAEFNEAISLIEIISNENSPYQNADTINYYLGIHLYFEENEYGEYINRYYDINLSYYEFQQLIIELETQELTEWETGRDDISFSRVSISSLHTLDEPFPLISTSYTSGGSYNLTNHCSPTAGAAIIMYYDFYFEDLIPNYSAYTTTTKTVSGYHPYIGYFSYTVAENVIDSTQLNTVESRDLVSELYDLMGTNSWGSGTVNTWIFSEALSGIRKYVEDKGYSIEFNRLSEFADLKSAILNNYPVYISASDYKLNELPSDNLSYKDEWEYEEHESGHAMVGYGYKTFTYYENVTKNIPDPNRPWYNFWSTITVTVEEVKEVNNMVKVATGWGNHSYEYLNFDYIRKADEVIITD